jgi:hypothetical protein
VLVAFVEVFVKLTRLEEDGEQNVLMLDEKELLALGLIVAKTS